MKVAVSSRITYVPKLPVESRHQIQLFSILTSGPAVGTRFHDDGNHLLPRAGRTSMLHGFLHILASKRELGGDVMGDRA